MTQTYYKDTPITPNSLGGNIPRRHGKLSQKLASWFLKTTGWQTVGEIPDIPQAVILAVPHTSNIDGVYALPALVAMDIDIRLMGKKELFRVPVLASFLRWVGIEPIDRGKKGSVLQASIERFKTGKPLFLGLAPEGTRKFTKGWKTGFYYLALGANVPIVPVAMDYATKEIRFMHPFYPTGDIERDLPKLYLYYQGVVPYHPDKLSAPLQALTFLSATDKTDCPDIKKI